MLRYPRRCKTSSVGQKCRTVNPEVVGSILAKTQKPRTGFEPHRPSSSGNKLLFQVIKAIIDQFLVKRDKLELAFWLLCSVHAVIQVPLDGVVGSRNCRYNAFILMDINKLKTRKNKKS